ncbi:zinc-dependent alcohol dehydrogenase family protein [Bacillus cytotoxicus]|uniref:zinc-dependent alcohol dehydrogenase family protein n=1 Tax=Bacillus cytotoxicus TaxID=580165 RepID=UPI0008641B0F|nr:zinc-dependent alcohol dehydrogenase family protein [Bacillus cytotoxicus]MDH2860217.1 zinc-dependent alcohol dehydrogenase family protein [Bacillus cytotoxicus]MDH2867877.1 zinc-dependent alcohol dehydrogenase family protein [Bacillus cytotoxicus]MDH2872331.1 zinc-dependent alcohol dehydrogenase family protein [Bacillus cytotoxicus]MDH2875762.1 zinc-dependent alcohol dehydrogenase family protein [Bacillus cytotoxicus]MDH2891529.1 zinc-dependent alcohol dehydrogenase family protein [Bacillu
MYGKCIKFYEFGSPKNVLKIEYKNIEPPKNKEIIVRMLARPINPSDLIPIRGAYAHRISLPNIPGYEGVGIVEDIGSLVSTDLIGKRVLPLRGEGTWQEFVKTSADFAIPIPDSINDFTAAQMYINPITAWVTCTEILKLKPNDVLLVNACGSSIGHLFAQLSQILGFRLIAVTRNKKYTEALLHLGASYVIDTSTVSLYEAVMELTNGIGADAAIDSIGGSDGNELAFCLHPNGNFLTIGLLSGIQVNWGDIVNRARVNANMFHLRNWNKNVSVYKWQETFHHLIHLIEDKKLRFMTADSTHDLTDVIKAIDAVESFKKTKGKVFLTSY